MSETPAQRSYRHALEDPELALHHARNLYESEHGMAWGDDIPNGFPWDDLTDQQKQAWVGRALDLIRRHAEDEPPDPDGGQPLRRTA